VATAVQGAEPHLLLRLPGSVHASVEDCQDRGAFVGPLRRYEDHPETVARYDGFVTLPMDVYFGRETVLRSASGGHVCPREGFGTSAVTVEPNRRLPIAPNLIPIRRTARSVHGAVSRCYPIAQLHQYRCLGCGSVWCLARPKKLFAMKWNNHEKECIRRFEEKSDSALSINYRELLGA
jgi:hypothetical protein